MTMEGGYVLLGSVVGNVSERCVGGMRGEGCVSGGEVTCIIVFANIVCRSVIARGGKCVQSMVWAGF